MLLLCLLKIIYYKGTGLTECILAAILSCHGKKVLHMDRNDYYGGDCGSLSLEQTFAKFKGFVIIIEIKSTYIFFILFKKHFCLICICHFIFIYFRPDVKPPEKYGRSRDYNIDLVPKFPLSKGNIMKAIVHTGCTRYLEFHRCKGAYVTKKGKPFKVPSDAKEATSTELVGFFQKFKLKNFLEFVANVDPKNKGSWADFDLQKQPMSDVYKKYGLDKDTQEFCGHAMALHLNEEFVIYIYKY